MGEEPYRRAGAGERYARSRLREAAYADDSDRQESFHGPSQGVIACSEQSFALGGRKAIGSHVAPALVHEGEGTVVRNEESLEEAIGGTVPVPGPSPEPASADLPSPAREAGYRPSGMLRSRTSDARLDPDPVADHRHVPERHARLRHPPRSGIHPEQEYPALPFAEAVEVERVRLPRVLERIVNVRDGRREVEPPRTAPQIARDALQFHRDHLARAGRPWQAATGDRAGYNRRATSTTLTAGRVGFVPLPRPTREGGQPMEPAWQELMQIVVGYLPKILGALAIFVVGWIVALLISGMVRAALRRTTLDDRIASWIVGEEKARTLDVERAASRAIFYLVMLFVLVAFFQALGLTLVTQPLNRALGEVTQFAPRVLGAGVLLLIAWIVASAVRMLLVRVPGVNRLDERLGDAAGLDSGQRPPITKTLADGVFWIVMLLFLPTVLGALQLEGLLAPVQGMLETILGFLPNLFSAAIILAVGWFAARIIQRVVSSLLAAVGADRLSERVGLAPVLGAQRLSGMLGQIVYVLVLIPIVVSALDALQLEAVSRPASDLLAQILGVLPALFGAALVIGVAFVIGRLLSGLVTNLLTGLGFNVVLARLGLGNQAPSAERSPSALVGFLVLVAVMLLATMEAFRMLGFTIMADFLAQFNVFASRVLFGLVLFALALFLANLVHERVRASASANATLLALLARLSILVLGAAMAIQQMRIGEEITKLVLTIGLGAVGVAAAIAFGLGGREPASRLVEEWMASLKGGSGTGRGSNA